MVNQGAIKEQPLSGKAGEFGKHMYKDTSRSHSYCPEANQWRIWKYFEEVWRNRLATDFCP